MAPDTEATPRVSLPGHTFREITRGGRDLLVEDPFRLVVPRPGAGNVHCVSYTKDGICIAWDTCGNCNLHVSICRHDVPEEPAYITRMRTGQEAPNPYRQTGVPRSESQKSRTQISGKGVPAGIAISDLVTSDVVAKVKAAKEARDE